MVSQELRLAGSADAVMNGFDWTVGVYYAERRYQAAQRVYLGFTGCYLLQRQSLFSLI